MDTTPAGSRAQDLTCALLPWLHNMGCGMRRIIGLETVPPPWCWVFSKQFLFFVFLTQWGHLLLLHGESLCSMVLNPVHGVLTRLHVMPEQEKHLPRLRLIQHHMWLLLWGWWGAHSSVLLLGSYTKQVLLWAREELSMEKWMKRLKWWIKFLKVKLSLTKWWERKSWIALAMAPGASYTDGVWFSQRSGNWGSEVKEQDHSHVRQQPLLLLLVMLDRRPWNTADW